MLRKVPLITVTLRAALMLLALQGLAQPAQAQDAAALKAAEPPTNAIWAETLDLQNMTTGRGPARSAVSTDKRPLSLGGVVYLHGIGTHADSEMTVDLQGAATRFSSMVGVDDETNKQGVVDFVILVDGKTAADSGLLKGGDPPKLLSVDLTGARTMVLSVTTGIPRGSQWDIYSNCHADWAGALFALAPGTTARPLSVDFSQDSSAFTFPVILPEDPRPAIHGPRITGASPHRPFLFGIAATGKSPLTYSVEGLPAGLSLDPETGILSGKMDAPGTYTVQVGVRGPAGEAHRSLSIVCGDHKLALTPPMGWDAWNVFGESVTAARVKQQVDRLKASGLAAHGFQTVIVDDTWQARRDPDGSIGPNRRFGNLQGLGTYIHSQGLKFGLYSSPTVQTCSGYAGSAGHEQQDAALYASWGVDYLKYDWCDATSTPKTATDDILKAAFGRMRTALDGVDRDIVYAINPYGYGKGWTWGSAVGANSWWTSPQILDQWKNIRDNGFSQNALAPFAGSGRWNDPGWLMMGRVGYSTPRFSHLALAEQMTQFSLWSLMAAPLILSCDLNQLDPNPLCPITTALLTNDEVIDVDQDSLGQPASKVAGVGDMEVWSRPLWDGTRAVGLFNTKAWAQQIQIQWSDLGLSGTQPVRDLWQHKDLGLFKGSYAALVPAHGVVLVKVGVGKV